MTPQRFASTKNPTHFVPLKEAVLRSLPPDNGLYMPEHLEALPTSFWENWRQWDFAELSHQVASHFLAGAVPESDLRELVSGAIDFPAPLVPVGEHHVLELFHGPTLAFKDFGARFMARLMGWLTQGDEETLTVLVATSGDTGGAVASAFHGVPGTRVIILYPSQKVSALQEKQLTTLGQNIHALEIEGTFDDCQALVKAAFLNPDLATRLNLTSANSINISRLLPQSFYYFEAARQLPEGKKPTFVVPSGNFGNLTAGLLAERLGLPVDHFVAATNINDVVPDYLASGHYQPRPSQATISNAMDVGAPSNFARLQALFDSNWQSVTQRLGGLAFDDTTTRLAIRDVATQHHYQLDPHGAVGWLAAEAWKKNHPDAHCVVLETAHPAKFLPTMEEELGANSVAIPPRLAELAERPKEATLLPSDESTFFAHLDKRF